MHLLLDTTQKQFYLEKTKAYFHLGSFHSAARHLTGYYIILTVAVNETDRWSPPLPLLWHLSEISAICSFWPQLQILWRGGSADLEFPSPCVMLLRSLSARHRFLSTVDWQQSIVFCSAYCWNVSSVLCSTRASHWNKTILSTQKFVNFGSLNFFQFYLTCATSKRQLLPSDLGMCRSPAKGCDIEITMS